MTDCRNRHRHKIRSGPGVAVTPCRCSRRTNVIANGGMYVDPKLVLRRSEKGRTRHPTAAAPSVASCRRRPRPKWRHDGASGDRGYGIEGRSTDTREGKDRHGPQDAQPTVATRTGRPGNYQRWRPVTGFVPPPTAARLAGCRIVGLDEETPRDFASGAVGDRFSRIA